MPVGLIAVAAGCGGGGVSKAGFLDKGKAVCNHIQDAAYRVDYSKVGVPPTSPEATDEDLTRFAAALDKTIAVYRDGLIRLRDLKPPSDFEARYTRALADVEGSLDRLGVTAEAARRGRRIVLRQALAASGRLSERARNILEAYGLTTCRF